MQNLLIHGDNLVELSKLVQSGFKNSIDLIYIDPPFATNQDFLISSERVSTISRQAHGKVAYSDNFTLDEYLAFLKPRLEIMYKLLSDQGSFYFHIDYKVGHYVKILLDQIFGFDQFRADISRVKCNPKNFSRKNYGNIKDMILFYTKTKKYIWNDIGISETDASLKKRFNKIDKKGHYTTIPLHAPGETVNGITGKKFMGSLPPKGRHWRYSPKILEKLYKKGMIEVSKTGNMRLKKYLELDKDKKNQDIWEFKDPQNPIYPTEKNSSMLDYIILNSSNQKSIVLDCFCGSGTALASAYKFGRFYIGIDQSKEAIRSAKLKLKKLDKLLL
tara:strand:+ start:188 stop:1180 length:993 start_codon:yes stop_codon:yes gene_type:complete